CLSQLPYCFFPEPAPTELCPLSLHDALPICGPTGWAARSWPVATGGAMPSRSGARGGRRRPAWPASCRGASRPRCPAASTIAGRSEEHTSELQSRENLVCRLLLEKKKKWEDV